MNNVTRRQIETLTAHLVSVASTARTRMQIRDAWDRAVSEGRLPRYETEYTQDVRMAALYYAWMSVRGGVR